VVDHERPLQVRARARAPGRASPGPHWSCGPLSLPWPGGGT
jgi:hypothetical protein